MSEDMESCALAIVLREASEKNAHW
jgi:hypothetical protein